MLLELYTLQIEGQLYNWNVKDAVEDVSRLGKERYVDFGPTRGESRGESIARFLSEMRAVLTVTRSQQENFLVVATDRAGIPPSESPLADKSQNVHNHERSAAC